MRARVNWGFAGLVAFLAAETGAIAAFVVSVLLAACGGGDDDLAPHEAAQHGERVTVPVVDCLARPKVCR